MSEGESEFEDYIFPRHDDPIRLRGTEVTELPTGSFTVWRDYLRIEAGTRTIPTNVGITEGKMSPTDQYYEDVLEEQRNWELVREPVEVTETEVEYDTEQTGC